MHRAAIKPHLTVTEQGINTINTDWRNLKNRCTMHHHDIMMHFFINIIKIIFLKKSQFLNSIILKPKKLKYIF
jgi:hypothetical protein